MQGNGLHMAKIVKIGPLPDDSYRYLADLTRNLSYDDGDGSATYIARTGMQVSAFVSSADLGVDNAEMDSLPAAAGFPLEGFTDEQIKAGELDGVEYVVYCLNYLDTSMGHFIWSGGTIGEARIKGTALFNFEQRSISNQLKQVIGDVDSTTCRAIFGSQPIGTGGGVVEERFPCGYDLTAEWVAFTVTDVHPTDNDLTFYSTDLDQADDYFRPGMVRWATGDNVGAQREVGAYTTDGVEGAVTLNYPTPHPVQSGDTGHIRRGCTKHWTGHNSCNTFFGADKTLHFRGEPHQPVGDASANMIPGAGAPTDIGGTGEAV